MSIGNRYRILKMLGEGAMGQVYAAQDRLTGENIALKQVHATLVEPLGFDESAHATVALANEFQILSGLRHPHIISVLDYGFTLEDGVPRPYFTMNLLEAPQLLTDATLNKTISAKIDILVQILLALDYLHRHHIVHRDLKPANVLVSNDHAYVLDFGLAVHTKVAEEEIAGTVNYIAPEILQGEKPSIASDLFAFGMMAIEVIANEYPYQYKNITGLIQSILAKPIDFDKLDVPRELVPILHQLTAKDPRQRPQSAYDMVRAFCDALEKPYPAETNALRDAILQAAPFVGREAERLQLRTATEQLIQDNKGSAWLIGGESGVGKSRLINELRTYALVKGAMVLKGEALDTTSDVYQMWYNAIRQLLLVVEINKAETKLLRSIIPDIDTLLDQKKRRRKPKDAANLESQLRATIVQLFGRITTPTVLILEDLQWADLTLLQQILAIMERVPLMVIGNYRIDEKPNMATEVNTMTHIQLERLSHAEIGHLAQAMLGTTTAKRDVLDVIQKESEGNVYFVVEVMRALAEEAGELGLVGVKDLPKSLFVGGISNLLKRRLNRIPAEGRPLLQLAALLGRNLDETILRYASQNPRYKANYDSWLQQCMMVSVLSVEGNRWRFDHDKLREYIIQGIEDKATLAADAAEIVHAAFEEVQPHHYALLAGLYEIAGDLHQEYDYRLEATRHSLDVYDHHSSNAHFERAFALSEMIDIPLDEVLALKVMNTMLSTFNAHRAKSILEKLLLQITDPNLLALVRIRLANSYRFLSQFDESQAMLAAALDHADKINDAQTRSTYIYELSRYYHLSGDYQQAVNYAEQGVEVAQQASLENDVVMHQSQIGHSSTMLGDLDKSLTYYLIALAWYRKQEHKVNIANSLIDVGVIYGRKGKSEESYEYYLEAYNMLAEIGHKERQTTVANNLGITLKNLGRYAEAFKMYAEAEAFLSKLDYKTTMHVSININRSIVETKLKRFADALHSVQNALAATLEIQMPMYTLFIMNTTAEMFMEMGQFERAAPYVQFVSTNNDFQVTQPIDRAKKFISENSASFTDEIMAAAQAQVANATLEDMYQRIRDETIST